MEADLAGENYELLQEMTRQQRLAATVSEQVSNHTVYPILCAPDPYIL